VPSRVSKAGAARVRLWPLLDVGDPIPEAQVWLAPREGLSLRDLVEEGPILVLFYLFDWSGT
jgi:hypothetical protein